MSSIFCSRLRIVVALSGLLLAANAFGQGKWIKLAPFPDASEELLGASAGGKMYVFCGLAPGWVPKALVYEYDPATDKWTKKKPMALPSHHVAFTEYRGKIYVFGGFVLPQSGPPSWVPINNAWEYDPANDNWKALAPMPTGRGSPVAVTIGDKMYVIGGAVPGPNQTAVHPARPHTSVGTVEEYDPATNTWRARASMPTPRNHATAGAVNGKAYVIGGRVGAAFVSGGSRATSPSGRRSTTACPSAKLAPPPALCCVTCSIASPQRTRYSILSPRKLRVSTLAAMPSPPAES